ncbi:hypothetical protein PHYSODRAFT_524629 [Phytophthora sojae]|uniref:Uncharacterized protein n=1 Tax=Phytophthora sojae (strain P6497) TaxID=1094619 RepID=G5A6T9_PHYSP|nr:hypothetical protein PHYSODRAFT_524629 [Phytophthora sojae]EGZ09044.1 hypothetical protein PHYSODRAFT_524629 [Phytophthora sojae]|eukprot:XP_009535677.1 hypothetical protein PHYSODRAFT_524629 [Phytophthora sojae]
MVDDRGDDDSFLADLTGFLNTLQPPTELQAPTATGIATDAADLLVDSDKLLAEMEALLASCDGPTRSATQVPRVLTGNADAEQHKALEDERRELRNKQAAKRRLKYRNKLKDERQTLREQEKTLSDELSELLQARKKAKAAQENSVFNPVWKGVATRQMEGRLVAEEQQHVQSLVDKKCFKRWGR